MLTVMTVYLLMACDSSTLGIHQHMGAITAPAINSVPL